MVKQQHNHRLTVLLTKSGSLVPLQMKSLIRKIGAQMYAFIIMSAQTMLCNLFCSVDYVQIAVNYCQLL